MNYCISLILFFTFALMIKNTTTADTTNFLREDTIRFLLPSVVSSIKINVSTILRIIKSFTIDLPIAYANIRV